MQHRHLSSLTVIPMVLGLFLAAPGQSILAKTTNAKCMHQHGAPCTGSKTATLDKDIYCTLMCDQSFKNLTTLLGSSGLKKTLEDKGTITLFAPNDAAFWKQRKGFIADISKDPKRLKSVLSYHVLPHKATVSELAGMRAAKTLEGSDVMISTKDGAVEIDGALITKGDIKCSNGVIHVIDDVLMPDRGK